MIQKMPDDLPYENTVIMNFESKKDMKYVVWMIRDGCRKQYVEGKVILINGTLQTSYEYEHDGT